MLFRGHRGRNTERKSRRGQGERERERERQRDKRESEDVMRSDNPEPRYCSLTRDTVYDT